MPRLSKMTASERRKYQNKRSMSGDDFYNSVWSKRVSPTRDYSFRRKEINGFVKYGTGLWSYKNFELSYDSKNHWTLYREMPSTRKMIFVDEGSFFYLVNKYGKR